MSEPRPKTDDTPSPKPPEAPQHRQLPEELGGASAVLDPHNERIKLYNETPENLARPEAQDLLERHFESNDDFTKLTVYAEPGAPEKWKKLGFQLEATIGGYFRNGEDAELWSRYSEAERARDMTTGQALEIAQTKAPVESPQLPADHHARIAGPEDAARISGLMYQTFPSYPDDITPENIERLISERSSTYVLIETEGEIAAMACGQLDRRHHNAEVSDCVTVAAHRGKRLMVSAIDRVVEHVARRHGVRDFYSMARADVVGINAALARAGFKPDGRLVNNSRMPEGYESFNIWWRRVDI